MYGDLMVNDDHGLLAIEFRDNHNPRHPSVLLPLAFDLKPPTAAAGALRRLKHRLRRLRWAPVAPTGAWRRRLVQRRRDQTQTPLMWRSEIVSGAEAPLSAGGTSGVQRHLSGVFDWYAGVGGGSWGWAVGYEWTC